MSMTYTKPYNVSYTDMCIWIDEHAYLEHCDETLLYEYLYHLSNMLAHEGRYFNSVSYYDEFSLYAASRLCTRLRNKKQFQLTDDGRPKLTPIKSILNYIKTVIYPYKVDFEQENYSSFAEDVTLLAENNFDFSEYLSEGCKIFSQIDFILSIGNISTTIRSYLSKIPHKLNSPEWNNIYLSCLLTILNSITPSKSQLQKARCQDSKERLDVLYTLLREKEPVLYHLDNTYTNIIKTLVKEIQHLLTRELNMELHSYIPTETALKNMLIPDMEEDEE